MASLDFGADIDSSRQTEVDRKYAEEKRLHRLGKEKEKAIPDPHKQVDFTGLPTYVPPPKPAAKVTLDKQTREMLKTGPPQAKAQKEIDAAAKAKVTAVRIYNNYYQREETRPLLPPRVNISVTSSDEAIATALASVRGALNAAKACETIRGGFPTAVMLLVRLLDYLGLLETLQIPNAAAAGPGLAAALRSPMMQTELTELEIELEPYFTTGLSMRLLIKVYMAIKVASEGAVARQTTVPAASMSAATLAALGLARPAAPVPEG